MITIRIRQVLLNLLNQLLLLFNRSIHGPFPATANARASDQFAAAAANQRNPERVQSPNGAAKSNGPVYAVYGDPRDHEPVSNCLDSTYFITLTLPYIFSSFIFALVTLKHSLN